MFSVFIQGLQVAYLGSSLCYPGRVYRSWHEGGWGVVCWEAPAALIGLERDCWEAAAEVSIGRQRR